MLTDSQREFLRTYKPESQMFTSEKEIELITEKLGLKNKPTEYLQSIRNEVVEFYSVDDIVPMWSITAVIDFFKSVK